VAVAKVLHVFAKANEKSSLRPGPCQPGDVRQRSGEPGWFAEPSEPLAKLLGTMQAPIAKFVQTLNEVPSKFVRMVAAVRGSKRKPSRLLNA
jgi:large subunit ribosomal protein L10